MLDNVIIAANKDATYGFMDAIFKTPKYKEREAALEEKAMGLLSGGEQQMLAIARGIMAHPKVMMFDEPSLGLAPVIIKEMFDVIKEINKEGTTVVLIEQNAQLALEFCDRAYILQTGKIVAEGKGSDLLKDESMIAAYLGE